LENTDKLYVELQKHLDKQAVGFPATKTGVELRILKELFTPEQAEVALHLSVEPKSVIQVHEEMEATGITVGKAAQLLIEMVKNGAITAKEENGNYYFFTMPLLVGIAEMHGSRATPQFWQDFSSYMAGEFGKAYNSTKVSQMRTIPVGKSITVEHHVTTYDNIRDIINTTSDPIVINQCMCRMGAAARGNPCQKTHREETCMAFGEWAKLAVKGGIQPISKEKALEIMRQNEEDGLVLQPNNCQKVDFVCACCGCCCGILGLQKAMSNPAEFWAHNYYVAVDAESCVGCGMCVERCQVNAIKMDENSILALINLERCIGCGNCVVACSSEALKLLKKTNAIVPPADAPALYKMLVERM
jgi:Na+-translocating ferredoxin:NAD+ oxidoreductase subunit B